MTRTDPEDLTARARIRDAALLHFGEQGFDRATIREIARTAGVSSGLVRHHFGSKQALREACAAAAKQFSVPVKTVYAAAVMAYELGK